MHQCLCYFPVQGVFVCGISFEEILARDVYIQFIPAGYHNFGAGCLDIIEHENVLFAKRNFPRGIQPDDLPVTVDMHIMGTIRASAAATVVIGDARVQFNDCPQLRKWYGVAGFEFTNRTGTSKNHNVVQLSLVIDLAEVIQKHGAFGKFPAATRSAS